MLKKATCLIGFFPAAALLVQCLGAASQPRAWWPQQYTVTENKAAGTLVLSTPYYTVEHDLRHGGVISRIHLAHGRAENLLVTPIKSSVHLQAPPAQAATRSGGNRARLVYSDRNDPSPSVSHQAGDGRVTVTVQARLENANGEDSGITTKTTYAYRWGYVKIHKEFHFPRQAKNVRGLAVLSAVFDPSLSHYGYRPGLRELMDPDLFSWRNGQIRRWGRIRPGTHFDLPFRTRQLPRYLVLANQGVEGIEWFMSDDLSQWDYQMSGQPGTGFAEVRPSTDPLGVAVSIYPLMLSSYYDLAKGGAAPLAGTYAFDYYLGVPILEGHAWNPWLDRGFGADGGKWVSEEQIRWNAVHGVVTMRLHNDGDSNRDGLFWRDGSYPPYPPAEMKKMDHTIALIHRYGMKAAPYFSCHELHQSTDAFKQHGRQWGRIVDTQGNLRPNYYYGAHMCLKSGWLKYLEFCVDRVLKNHDFDGIYYDWNIAMFCNNPLHVGKKTTGVSGKKGLALPAFSPTAHWDIDELIELVEWTRRRVGPDGLLMLHNTLVPMFTTENFANYVVGMEFSYGKVSLAMPRPDELPLEWNFVGARSRGVIGYGTIGRQAPEQLRKAFALTALLTSVAPWPATDDALAVYKILKPLGDLEQYQFEDYRNRVVNLDGHPSAFSAVYSKAGEAYILLANLKRAPRTVRCVLAPEKLVPPLPFLTRAEIVDGGRRLVLDAKRLTTEGEEIRLPATGAILLHVE